jgi:hypothetical protein
MSLKQPTAQDISDAFRKAFEEAYGPGSAPTTIDKGETIDAMRYLRGAGQGIDFIPVTIKIDDTRHKCKCDLTGANCWLGCRCGGK